MLSPVVEPLELLTGARITSTEAYRDAGWSAALAGTRARQSVVFKVQRVAQLLPDRFGLHVFDAWRPLALQSELFDAAYSDPHLPPGFVAEPVSDPRFPPPHLTGGTVDLTLSFDGVPLSLGTPFDGFTSDAHTDVFEAIGGAICELRRLLYWSMRSEGFVVLNCEWWHFEYGTRRWAALTGNEPIFGPCE